MLIFQLSNRYENGNWLMLSYITGKSLRDLRLLPRWWPGWSVVHKLESERKTNHSHLFWLWNIKLLAPILAIGSTLTNDYFECTICLLIYIIHVLCNTKHQFQFKDLGAYMLLDFNKSLKPISYYLRSTKLFFFSTKV